MLTTTPSLAEAVRSIDSVYHWLKCDRGLIATLFESFPCAPAYNGAAFIDYLLRTRDQTDIVMWEREMWQAAVNGVDQFIGTRPGPLCRHPALWVLDSQIIMAATEDNKVSGFFKEQGYEAFGIFLCPLSARGVQELAKKHFDVGAEDSPYAGTPLGTMLPRFQEVRPDTYATGLVLLLDSTRDPNVPAVLFPVLPIPEDVVIDAELGDWAHFVARFKFLELPFIEKELFALPRPMRRQAKREGRPPPRIYTIALRRRETSGAADTSSNGEGREAGREWGCRWIVRGHWRKQWYASMREHKVIWIDQYLKGPEDKPLKSKRQRIYHVCR